MVGELQDSHQTAAAARIGAALGWPVVADVLSGERLWSYADTEGWPCCNVSAARCNMYVQTAVLMHHVTFRHLQGCDLGVRARFPVVELHLRHSYRTWTTSCC